MNKILVYSLIIVIISSGCYGVKKAEKQTVKAYVHYPVMIAEKTRTWFPCITTSTDSVIVYKEGKADTVTNMVDVPYYINEVDTIWQQVKVPCKDKIIRDTIYSLKTIKIKDSADVRIIQAENEQISRERGKYYAEAKEWKDKAKTRVKWIFGLSTLLLCSLIWNFRKLIFKII